MEKVVHTDSEHKDIKTLFKHPVKLGLPLLKAPLLGLKTVKTSVGKVAETAIIETGRLGQVDALGLKLAFLYPVTVPEPTATEIIFEIAINGVDCSSSAAACEDEKLFAVGFYASDTVIVGTVAYTEAVGLTA